MLLEDIQRVIENLARRVRALEAREFTSGVVGPGVVPLPADTVVTEQTFGQDDDPGAATTYSRSDHTHGTPPDSGKRAFTFAIAGDCLAAPGAFRLPNHFGQSMTLLGVYLNIDTAPTGHELVVDIHKNGVTIFTTQANRPQIAAGAYSGSSTTLDVTSFADSDYLTADIDDIGSTISGADLTITVMATF